MPVTTDIIPVVPTEEKDNSDIRNPNELPEAYAKIVIFIIVAIMVFSFVGNVLALSSLARNKKNVYPWFFNLALSDLIKTVLCMPYSVYIAQSSWFEDKIGFINGSVHCQFFGYIFNLVLFMGLISNMCVALDRVHATYFPFHYSMNQRRFPAHYLILVMWCAVALLAALPFYLQLGKEAKSPFGLHGLQPMCIFDAWDMDAFKYATRDESDVYIPLYYAILYGVPVIVIVTSTCLVMHKLLPRLIAERKIYQNAKKTVVFCNSTLGDEPGMTTIGLDNMETTASSPKPERKVSKFSIDNLMKLHTSTKQNETKGRTKRNQEEDDMASASVVFYWRAIQTMIYVSVAFVVCHAPHIMYWVLYESVFKEIDKHASVFGISQSRYIVLACVQTGQIILVYFDSAVNVIVYYSRCTLIKESMTEQAGTFVKVVMTPLFILIRSRRG